MEREKELVVANFFSQFIPTNNLQKRINVLTLIRIIKLSNNIIRAWMFQKRHRDMSFLLLYNPLKVKNEGGKYHPHLISVARINDQNENFLCCKTLQHKFKPTHCYVGNRSLHFKYSEIYKKCKEIFCIFYALGLSKR